MLTDSAIASATVHLLNHLDGMHVDLFGPGGRAGTATLTIVNQTRLVEECPDWPTGTLTNFSGGSWKVGLERDRAAALPLDSLEAMNRQDSAEVTIELARLASRYAVQGAQGEDSAFRGLPFAVRKAYRFRLGDRSVIVADIVRRVNQEANPLAEHVLIVAERVESATGAAYVVGYHARAAGSEDAVRTTEILAAVRMSQGDRAAIVLSYGYEEGSRVSLLERAGAGMWRMRWRSAYTGC